MIRFIFHGWRFKLKRRTRGGIDELLKQHLYIWVFLHNRLEARTKLVVKFKQFQQFCNLYIHLIKLCFMILFLSIALCVLLDNLIWSVTHNIFVIRTISKAFKLSGFSLNKLSYWKNKSKTVTYLHQGCRLWVKIDDFENTLCYINDNCGSPGGLSWCLWQIYIIY